MFIAKLIIRNKKSFSEAIYILFSESSNVTPIGFVLPILYFYKHIVPLGLVCFVVSYRSNEKLKFLIEKEIYDVHSLATSHSVVKWH